MPSSHGVYMNTQEILSRLKAYLERWRVFVLTACPYLSFENFSLPLSALRTPVYYAVYNEAILHIDAKSTHPWPVAVDTHFYSCRLQITISGGRTPHAVDAAVVGK